MYNNNCTFQNLYIFDYNLKPNTMTKKEQIKQNQLRSPSYFKVRDVIRSCKNLLHWKTALQCLENYERKHAKEYGLRQELNEKENQLFI